MSAPALALSVSDLSKSFSDRSERRAALGGVSLRVLGGRTLSIVGPSGAGKSTLLRTIAGLERPDAGSVCVGERDVSRLPPQARRIAVVFQYDALVAHMSVEENLGFAPRAARGSEEIADVSRAFELEPYARRKPRELSGGERQRVAIARALLSNPDVLLLDEPLVHLDPPLRARVRDEVVHLRGRFRGPIVYVTHDHAEAMAVGDELAVLIGGRLEQIGEPQEVYDAPQNVRVARFLGAPPMNLLDTVGESMGFGSAIVGIRPEHVFVGGGDMHGRIVRAERQGADAYLHVASDAGTLIARVRPDRSFGVGDRIEFAFPRERVRLFDRRSGEAIA